MEHGCSAADLSHSNWKWPNLKGLQSFKGAKMHSADWNNSFDFKNKKIVMIGNGSSGVQIAPVLQKGMSIRMFIKAKLTSFLVLYSCQAFDSCYEVTHMDHSGVCPEVRWSQRRKF